MINISSPVKRQENKEFALVSVVIPAFNNEPYIADTIKSILSQTYSNLEILIADHGSTDKTKMILESFLSDSRIRLFDTAQGGGAATNWNRVSHLANGTYLRLVCGDDLLDPTSIEKHVRILDLFEEVNLVASARRVIGPTGKVIIRFRGLGNLKGLVSGLKVIRLFVRSGTNVLGEPACVTFRTKALREAGWWQKDAKYLLDQATYTNVLLNSNLYVIREVLAGFRVSTSQWSYRLSKTQAMEIVQFNRTIRDKMPNVISRIDLFSGNIKARINANLRKLVYLYLDIKSSNFRPQS